MTKIVWVVNSPISIYGNFFEELGKDENLDLVMISEKTRAFDSCKNFKKIILPTKDLSGWLFFYRKILSFLEKDKIYKSKVKSLYYKGLHSFLKKESPDVVMSTLYFVPSTWQVYRYCRKTGTPFILWVKKKRIHAGVVERIFHKASLFLCKNIFRKADFILGFTDDSTDFARKNFPITDKQKIKCLPIAGVDTGRFYPMRQNEEEDPLNIIVPARYVPMKWHEGIIKAAHYLKDHTDSNFRITFLGSGPLESELRERASEFGVTDKIKWKGKIPHEKMNEEFNRHDVMLLASYSEPIGRVVTEAMAAGLPVIVSDQVGAKTYVREGENGYIFRNLDHKDMADKILLMMNRDWRKKLGDNARGDMEDRYSFDTLTEEFKKNIYYLTAKKDEY
jgi:glycosyltransferase involved in cell wall biosynthesis